MQKRRRGGSDTDEQTALVGAACCVLLLFAAVVFTERGSARSELVASAALRASSATDKAVSIAADKALHDGVDKLEQTKRFLELRGRTLARRMQALTRAVKDEEEALKRHGVETSVSQIQDVDVDIDDMQSALKRVSRVVKIPALKEEKERSTKVTAEQKTMLDKSLVLVDLALKNDQKAAAEKKATEKEEAAYKQALVKAVHYDTKLEQEKSKIAVRKSEAEVLKKEKALLRAREHREALERLAEARRKKEDALQKDIDASIARGLRAAKSVLNKVPSKDVARSWAAALKAAVKGDNHSVAKFCSTQTARKDCVRMLFQHAHAQHRSAKKPCNAELPGYFRCIGVTDTGGTLG